MLVQILQPPSDQNSGYHPISPHLQSQNNGDVPFPSTVRLCPRSRIRTFAPDLASEHLTEKISNAQIRCSYRKFSYTKSYLLFCPLAFDKDVWLITSVCTVFVIDWEISLFQNWTNCHILDLFPRVIVIWWAVMVVKACKSKTRDGFQPSRCCYVPFVAKCFGLFEPEICGTVTKIQNIFFFFRRTVWSMSRTWYINILSILGEWCSSKNLYVWVNVAE